MRIAIVNDVRMAVEALRRVVTSVPEYQIAWIAENGEQAVKLCAANVPDLILMDLLMPKMDGVEASRLIMQDTPCAILVVTSTVGGNSSKYPRPVKHGRSFAGLRVIGQDRHDRKIDRQIEAPDFASGIDARSQQRLAARICAHRDWSIHGRPDSGRACVGEPAGGYSRGHHNCAARG